MFQATKMGINIRKEYFNSNKGITNLKHDWNAGKS
jgi:hypothetical protein